MLDSPEYATEVLKIVEKFHSQIQEAIVLCRSERETRADDGENDAGGADPCGAGIAGVIQVLRKKKCVQIQSGDFVKPSDAYFDSVRSAGDSIKKINGSLITEEKISEALLLALGVNKRVKVDIILDSLTQDMSPQVQWGRWVQWCDVGGSS